MSVAKVQEEVQEQEQEQGQGLVELDWEQLMARVSGLVSTLFLGLCCDLES